MSLRFGGDTGIPQSTQHHPEVLRIPGAGGTHGRVLWAWPGPDVATPTSSWAPAAAFSDLSALGSQPHSRLPCCASAPQADLASSSHKKEAEPQKVPTLLYVFEAIHHGGYGNSSPTCPQCNPLISWVPTLSEGLP